MYELTKTNNTQSVQADPFARLARDFFGFPLAASRTPEVVAHAPRFDFVESEEAYTLRADLPGITENNLDITLDDGIWSVHGTREENKTTENDNFLVQERQFGEFSRRLKLPSDADPEKVEAKLDAGVLAITIEKKEERKARKIKLG